jgi:hypothetical protein
VISTLATAVAYGYVYLVDLVAIAAAVVFAAQLVIELVRLARNWMSEERRPKWTRMR